MRELPLLVAITGASGTIYAAELLHELQQQQIPVHLVMSSSAQLVAAHEGYNNLESLVSCVFSNGDLFAPPASGTAPYRAMVVVPCSMGTVGRLAAGSSDSLLTRAADVQLKEGRQLILVPREAPLSTIHLQNLLRLKEAGATILPASPHFYQQPQTVRQVAQTVVAKLLDQLRIPHTLVAPWGAP